MRHNYGGKTTTCDDLQFSFELLIILTIHTYILKILDVFFRTKNLVKTNIIFVYQSSLGFKHCSIIDITLSASF